MRTRVSKDEENAAKTKDAEVATESPDPGSRIKKQGKRADGIPAKSAAQGEPGLYEVIHGRISFGYRAGEAIYAEPGAIVELNAEEAGRLLAEKIVRKAG